MAVQASFVLAVMTLLLIVPSVVIAQGDTLGLNNGYLTLQTSNFDIQLTKDAQVLASLKPIGNAFDFSPLDDLPRRAGNGQYHLGDITFRYRFDGSGNWTEGDSAVARAPVNLTISSSPSASGSSMPGFSVLAASNLAPTLPNKIPLRITRQWLDLSGDLGLSFTLMNTASKSIELGSLGFPIEFNSIFTNRTSEEAQQKCSLTDPYIGLDAGYIQVTPLQGIGAALVITPMAGTPFEAWRNLNEPSFPATLYGSQTFEGFYEWQVYSKAWAENEWKGVTPWNVPTSKVLGPGKSLTVGLRFSLAQNGGRDIESAVKKTGTPYAVGIPGYVVPQDLTARLYLYTNSTVNATTVEPAGALQIGMIKPNAYTLTPATSGWGRTRLTISYSDGRTQTIHYYIICSAPNVVRGLGNFLATSQWYTDEADPFMRAPSVISYDRSVNKPVTQDDRVWIAGLSDEAGAGSFLAAGMKQSAQPQAGEVAKLEQFVDGVLWKTIQQADYGVRKSIFFYQPDAVPGYLYDSSLSWDTWESWNKSAAYSTNRAYDYVHVAALYWSLYRAGRAYPSLLTHHTWNWYLMQAYRTAKRCVATDANGNPNVAHSDDGLMGETVFGELLQDLRRESRNADADDLEAAMRVRAVRWDAMVAPFGSEQAWDSTGQEGVYYWSKYFGYNSTARKAINSVLGYMPTVAHWGWNGNARRYWDNLYGGKLQRIERQIHHYGSGLNSLPILSDFRSNPSDTYLLRVGYGGMNGPLTNIDQEGFASASFHSWPDTLAWDAYSGDYGPNFVGLMLGSATYIVQDSELGLEVFGGNLAKTNDGSTAIVQPRDAVRRRVFVGPLGLYISIDAGVIEEISYEVSNAVVTVTVSASGAAPEETAAESAILWLEATASGSEQYTVITAGLSRERLGWKIPLISQSNQVKIGNAQSMQPNRRLLL